MSDFLLELLTEEIPARMQAKAAADLARLFAEACAARGLALEPVAHVTPRRLALLAHGLPAATAPTREERRGPRADAPEGAIAGFLKSAGVAREALEAREDAKGRFLYAVIERPGRAVADVLAEAVVEAAGKLPWPKSMRWGAASASMDSPRWVRPLVGVVALLGEAVVPVTVLGIAAGRETMGHRFLSHAPVQIASPASYAAQLRDAHVIVDAAERATIIAEGARAAATAAGLALIEDDGLVAENAGLAEWPVALLGRFDPAFLDLPREVIQLTMRTNQKYFACAGPDGTLAPAFACVANIPGADGGAVIVEGNRRVLAARLSDARFFWEQDRARKLEDYLPRLEQVVFHEKLGTMRDKAERVAGLARWLVESGAVKPNGAPPPNPPHKGEGLGHPQSNSLPLAGRVGVGITPPGDVETLAALAHRAGLLAKADLTTAMVGEFPELQGTMGGYYALASGEDPAVAAAIRDHYRPVGPADGVPVEPVSVAVALADKLDTLVAMQLIREQATGSRDPFALRRAAIGVLSLIAENECRVSLVKALTASFWSAMKTRLRPYSQRLSDVIVRYPDFSGQDQISVFYREAAAAGSPIGSDVDPDAVSNTISFIVDRLKVQQREAGIRHDLIDAVFALGGEDDLVRLLARVRALQAFVATEDGANLLAAFKRAANILAIEAKRDGVARFEDASPPSLSLPSVAFPSPASAGEGQVRAAHQGEGGAEAALAAVLDPAAADAAAAVAAEDFAGAMASLARLRGPIDAFFDSVMVNDPDPAVRLARLSLLQRFHDAVQQVADFSKIEG